MAETPKCTSWLGHKFEARYSNAAPKDDIMTVMAALNDNTVYAGRVILDGLTSKTYEHDICTRCGFVVERKTPAKATE